MNTLYKIHDLLTPQERRRAYLLIPLVLLMGVMEVAGVASIMPFLALVADPDQIHTHPLLSRFAASIQVNDATQFLLIVGMLVLGVIVISNSVSALTIWLLLRFASMRNYSVSKRLLDTYLRQDYAFFLTRNSSELSNKILSETERVVNFVIMPGMQLIARSVVVLAILLLLVAVDPLLATISALVLGGSYATIYTLIKRKLSTIGRERFQANAQRFKAASEAMGAIKDIKLGSKEAVFLDQYARPTHTFARHLATNEFLGQLPRYILEVVAFGGIVLIVLYLLGIRGNLTQALPLIGLYAFASYRLMPYMQNIFGWMTLIRFNLPALDALHEDISNANPEAATTYRHDELPDALPFRESLELRSVSFRHLQSETPVLKNIDLTIRPNTSIAFVGQTGSGKTTIVDLILGLLKPSTGKVLIDGVPLTDDNLSLWQLNLGYVPQHIYLSDDTIARNIAFGIPKDRIDMQAVERAAKIATIHDFITNELSEGYDSQVGERGVRLSGGQRQRIGIARALYHDPSVLVLDEATSALDNTTERLVYEAIDKLKSHKTLILIAHRLSTVEACDVIHILEKGQVVHSGDYATLLANNKAFKSMVGATPSRHSS